MCGRPAIFNLFCVLAHKVITKILWHTQKYIFADLTKNWCDFDSLALVAIVWAVVIFYVTILRGEVSAGTRQ